MTRTPPPRKPQVGDDAWQYVHRGDGRVEVLVGTVTKVEDGLVELSHQTYSPSWAEGDRVDERVWVGKPPDKVPLA